MISHSTVEVVAFPCAQFQTCVISAKAVVEWPPYNVDLYSLIIPPSPTPWFKYTYKNWWPSMSWRKQLKSLSTWFQSRWSEMWWAIFTKNAKPANKLKATTLSIFFIIPRKQFWILFRVLVSFSFYELYFSSYALIVGVSREKSYCSTFFSSYTSNFL